MSSVSVCLENRYYAGWGGDTTVKNTADSLFFSDFQILEERSLRCRRSYVATVGILPLSSPNLFLSTEAAIPTHSFKTGHILVWLSHDCFKMRSTT